MSLMEMQTVLGLLPIMRFEEELEERSECSTAHHEPVNGNKKGPTDQVVARELHTTKQVHIRIEKVSEDQTECSHVEDRHREQGVVQINRAEDDVEDQQHPEQRI